MFFRIRIIYWSVVSSHEEVPGQASFIEKDGDFCSQLYKLNMKNTCPIVVAVSECYVIADCTVIGMHGRIIWSCHQTGSQRTILQRGQCPPPSKHPPLGPTSQRFFFSPSAITLGSRSLI